MANKKLVMRVGALGLMGGANGAFRGTGRCPARLRTRSEPQRTTVGGPTGRDNKRGPDPTRTPSPPRPLPPFSGTPFSDG
jgi:hypothetical protein